jgi:hypothetical protein
MHPHHLDLFGQMDMCEHNLSQLTLAFYGTFCISLVRVFADLFSCIANNRNRPWESALPVFGLFHVSGIAIRNTVAH